MKILLVCIGRLENLYIREYVEYYKNIGMTNICICDNNFDNEEHFEDVIQDYIDSEFVFIENYRNKTYIQLDAYKECYKKYSNKYDWICFFDIDEFLTFVNPITISEFLSQEKFNSFNAIRVNWVNYGDNNLLTYDNRLVTERFLIPYDLYAIEPKYNLPINYHTKSIIRGGMNNIYFVDNPHVTNAPMQCSSTGKQLIKHNNVLDVFAELDISEVYLRHYTTKSCEEYCKKLLRGFPDHIINDDEVVQMLYSYFYYNRITVEKINLISKLLNVKIEFK